MSEKMRREPPPLKKRNGLLAAAGLLTAALGLSSDHGTRSGLELEEQTTETSRETDNPASDSPPDKDRARRARSQLLERAVRGLHAAADAEQAPSITRLAQVDINHDDLMEFAQQLAQNNPNASVGDPRFLRLVDTMRVDHDGTSFYIYSDSDELNAYASRFPGVHLETLMVIEQDVDPSGQTEYSLNVFADSSEGVVPLGTRIIISNPEQLKFRIAERITDELASLVINGFPTQN